MAGLPVRILGAAGPDTEPQGPHTNLRASISGFWPTVFSSPASVFCRLVISCFDRPIDGFGIDFGAFLSHLRLDVHCILNGFRVVFSYPNLECFLWKLVN